ncbi:MAG TPA: hypothetical protein PLP29_19510 [Candidatus Ozemobacteraceae bacterium]|nr:hypothetical protein [Candidatus Ozemobacteraceae bacterium]
MIPSDSFEFDVPGIKLFGIGNSGIRALCPMSQADEAIHRRGIEYIALCTDAKETDIPKTGSSIVIEHLFADKASTEHSQETACMLDRLLGGADMVILLLALGCKASVDAAQRVAKASRERSVLTVVIAARPLPFESQTRMSEAARGIDALREAADAMLVFSPEKLVTTNESHLSISELHKRIDDTFTLCVRSLTDHFLIPGLICVDFRDVKTVLTGAGIVHIGVGSARGENRASAAARMAKTSALFEGDLSKARSLLVTIPRGHNIIVEEVNTAMHIIMEGLGEDINVIVSTPDLENDDDLFMVTIIASNS